MAPSPVGNNKVSIYPIEVTIEAAGGPYKGNCLKITDQGMIMEVFVSTFSPHQLITVKWLLPVENIAMQEESIVVKKYTQNRSGKIIYLMEIHFKQVKFSNASAIISLIARLEDGTLKTKMDQIAAQKTAAQTKDNKSEPLTKENKKNKS